MAKTKTISPERAAASAAPSVEKAPPVEKKSSGRLYVDIDTSIEDVIRLDREGVELFFESDKGKFLELDDATLKELSQMTRIHYDVSRALNAKHDPAMDGFSARFSVGEARNRQSQVQAILRDTPMTADAKRLLTAYAGHGFKERWARPDKIAHWMQKGYSVVEADSEGKAIDPNVFTEAKAIGGHFETQGTKPNETELVLMRAPLDVVAKNRKALDDLAKRQEKAVEAEGTRSGLSDRVAARQDLSWTER